MIKELINKAYQEGANIPYTQHTPYINTIPPEAEVKSNGDQNIERRIRSLIRWNAAAMVVRANKKFPELGGHIGTFASAATLYDVGMNHFWRAKNNKFGGDLVYFQGHSAPGCYARAFLEGRLNEKQLDSFRQEVKLRGTFFISTPLVDAKVLAVSNCVNGIRTYACNLPGEIYEIFN